jgi:hypothetical protein
MSAAAAGALGQPAQPAPNDQGAGGAANHSDQTGQKKKPAKGEKQSPTDQNQSANGTQKPEDKNKAASASGGAASSGAAGGTAPATGGVATPPSENKPGEKNAATAAPPAAAPPSTPPAAPSPPPGAAQPAPESVGANAHFGVAATVGAPAAPQSESAQASKKKHEPLTNTLGIEIEGGTNARLDGTSPGLGDSESVGLTYGLGVWYSPARLWSLGLSFQRTGLGGDSTAPTGTSVSVDRNLDSLWLSGRAYPWRTDSLGVYLALELGATWQHVDASGAVEGDQNVTPAQPFACSATAGPGVALGAGAGLDVDLDDHLAFLVQADIAAHRLTSDEIGGCTQGSGSVSDLAARIGFMYRFGIGPQQSSATASGTPTLARF